MAASLLPWMGGPPPAPVLVKGSIEGEPASLCLGKPQSGFEEAQRALGGEMPPCDQQVPLDNEGRFRFEERPGKTLRAQFAGGSFHAYVGDEPRSLPALAPGRHATLTIGVADAAGLPVAGARVFADRFENSPAPALWRPAIRSAQTDAAGEAKMTFWPGESFQLTVVAPGYLPWRKEEIEPRVEGLLPLKLEPRPARTIEVLDRDGMGLAGTLVQWQWIPLGSTDENGRLEVFLDEDAPLAFFNRQDRDWRIMEPAWQHRLLQLYSGDRKIAAGRIFGPDGEPAGGARIQARGYRDSFSEVRSGPDGRFSFGPLERGTYRLRAILPGYADADGKLEIPIDGSAPTAALLKLGGVAISVAGKVLDEGGSPLAGAEVRLARHGLTPDPDPVPADAVSAADGSYRIDGLHPWEKVELQATFPGRLPVRLRQVIVDGTGVPDLRLAPEATLEIAVTGGDAGPLAGARVVLALPGNQVESVQSGYTGEDGRLRFTGLEAGSYQLRVKADGFVPERRETTLSGARQEAVELGRGASLEGIFLDLQGKPIEGARILVHDSRLTATCCHARTDEEGRYRIRGIGAGSWLLHAHLEGRVPLVEALAVAEPKSYRKDFQLVEGEKLHGVVRDSSGNPLAGAQVAVFSRSRPDLDEVLNAEDWAGVWTTTLTDSEGRFTLEHLGRQHYSLSVSAPDHRRIRHEVDIAGTGTLVEIALPPAGGQIVMIH
jgi:protocatechuate 3,4-dioxygenase beta subunit